MRSTSLAGTFFRPDGISTLATVPALIQRRSVWWCTPSRFAASGGVSIVAGSLMRPSVHIYAALVKYPQRETARWNPATSKVYARWDLRYGVDVVSQMKVPGAWN